MSNSFATSNCVKTLIRFTAGNLISYLICQCNVLAVIQINEQPASQQKKNLSVSLFWLLNYLKLSHKHTHDFDMPYKLPLIDLREILI